MLSLGGDVEKRVVQTYIAFRRKETFAWVHFRPSGNRLVIGMPLSLNDVEMEPGFAAIDKNGFPEIYIDSDAAVQRAMPLIKMSYSIS